MTRIIIFHSTCSTSYSWRHKNNHNVGGRERGRERGRCHAVISNCAISSSVRTDILLTNEASIRHVIYNSRHHHYLFNTSSISTTVFIIIITIIKVLLLKYYYLLLQWLLVIGSKPLWPLQHVTIFWRTIET